VVRKLKGRGTHQPVGNSHMHKPCVVATRIAEQPQAVLRIFWILGNGLTGVGVCVERPGLR
jgi:hypothetical protein